MPKPTLSKTYDPKKVEHKLYRRWEASGFFNPDKLPGMRLKRFTIAMPPPNVTGDLHIGHALTIAVEDALVRYHRMKGEKALWVPGVDHAGIATQVKVERMLTDMNLSRHDIGREAFLKHVWSWKRKYGDTITKQIRSLGASCDWSREHFTMDANLTAAVHEAFTRLFSKGLVYRGERVIHWCPKDQTSLSDLEVVYEEMPAKLYFINYGLLTVATQRPETMLGDTAVAVNPRDGRYRRLIGKRVVVPLTGREVPVVADAAINQDFGTGAVKVTPAHDLMDWDIGQRHRLPWIQIIGSDGKLTAAAGEFAGFSVMDARKRIIEELQSEGLLVKVEDYVTKIPLCDRCRTVIEPLISKQWFLSVRAMADRALAAVRDGKIVFVPGRFKNVFERWMVNIRDWNISRQLWWGHRIPVWTRPISPAKARTWDLKLYGQDTYAALECGEMRFETRAGRKPGTGKDWRKIRVGDLLRFTPVDPKTERPLGDRPIIRRIAGIQHFPSREALVATIPLRQIAPHMTHETFISRTADYPGYAGRIKRYGIFAFELIREHGEVRETAVGAKKPAGAGWTQEEDTLDTWFSSGLWTFSTLGWPQKTRDLARFHPTDVMETGWDILFFWVARMIMFSQEFLDEVPFRTVYLHGLILDKDGKKMSKSKGTGIDPLVMTEKYGTDALRLSLLIGQAAGQDFRMIEDKVAHFRNFVNKLWNVARYIQNQQTTNYKLQTINSTMADRWIVARLSALTREVTAHLDRLELSLAGERLVDFLWHDLADWYIEIHKFERNTALLRSAFEQYLRLLHPFAPFITEQLWQTMAPRRAKEFLMVAPWPKVKTAAEPAEFLRWQTTIRALRNFRLHSGYAPDDAVSLDAAAKNPPLYYLTHLAGITFAAQPTAGEKIRLGFSFFRFPTERVAVFATWRNKERSELERYIAGKEQSLKNSRLPEAVRQQFAVQLTDAKQRLADL